MNKDRPFDFITNRLAVGNLFSRSVKGWAAVVSVIKKDQLEAFGSPKVEDGVPVFYIDIDDGEEGLEKHLDAVILFIFTHIRNGCVLIHCAAGMSRSVSVAMAYLCRTIGFTVYEAERLLRKRRPISYPAEVFKEAIRKWLNTEKLDSSGPREYNEESN